ncbi:hypothetical protein [Clavibacter capsici]|uniref:hypothetical protein n=1 Tax=Clavibacter capsici TaxID=1874630 RepID=UPI00211D0CE8|nr:hypothetical protein [Clavibacter capsici]
MTGAEDAVSGRTARSSKETAWGSEEAERYDQTRAPDPDARRAPLVSAVTACQAGVACPSSQARASTDTVPLPETRDWSVIAWPGCTPRATTAPGTRVVCVAVDPVTRMMDSQAVPPLSTRTVDW